MKHTIYCDCCELASVETTETPSAETFYMCRICREYCVHLDVEVKKNNFNEDKAIDYSN